MAMNPRTKRILIGCGAGCGGMILILIALAVGFGMWIQGKGELLEPQRLLGADTTGYLEWTLRLEDPGTEGSSAITFRLEADTRVRRMIFDIKGRGVRQLLRHRLPPGSYSILWDGRNDAGRAQPSGIYFYQLSLNGRARTQQLLLLK